MRYYLYPGPWLQAPSLKMPRWSGLVFLSGVLKRDIPQITRPTNVTFLLSCVHVHVYGYFLLLC